MTTITFSPFFLLIISICAEVFGTMSLGKSSGFTYRLGFGSFNFVWIIVLVFIKGDNSDADSCGVRHLGWAGKCFDGFVSLDAF